MLTNHCFLRNQMLQTAKKILPGEEIFFYHVPVYFLFVILNMSWIKYFVGKKLLGRIACSTYFTAANLCLGIYLNQSMWYKLSGQTKFGAYISIVGAVITIVLNIILIPQIGYTGAAITTFITYASMMIISYIMSLKYYPINYDLKTMGIFLLLTIAIYAASTFIQSQNIASNGVLLAINELMLGLFLFVVYKKEIRRLVIYK
ncbi:MAG: polysaccharide biosynthesis C-terminal domain-containing protein [Bacteroidetes bacterium]|nr:polysaccharide biosynthesis C-terminal domain-containing protein [Bacteroidota bacterium]